MFKAIAKFWNGLPPAGKVAVGLGVAYGTYKGVKYFRSRIAHVPLPTGGLGIPVAGYTNTGTPIPWNPAPVVEAQYGAMDGGGSFSGTKDEAWTLLLNLPTADMLTAVYNAFNADPRAEGDSLTQWIRDEIYYDYISGVKAAVLAKLTGAGLN